MHWLWQLCGFLPGLAIFLLSLKNGGAQVTMPYEMINVPEKGEKVDGLDRYGKKVCDARWFA